MIAGSLNLFDFGIVGEQLSISELLHSSYIRGRQDILKEIETDFQNNLQSAAQSSSLLKSKLQEKSIEVKDMFLKVVDFNTFKCLVIIDKDDYFSKEKRKHAYKVARNINDTNSRIELSFSIMSHSKDIVDSNITSDGYILRYGQKEI
jgi:hypothetical protein